MPAAAVIPAPIAYIKVVAVKKLVVGFTTSAVAVRRSVRSASSPAFVESLRRLRTSRCGSRRRARLPRGKKAARSPRCKVATSAASWASRPRRRWPVTCR